MAMNKTEAVYVNTMLRWMMGDPDVTTAQAYEIGAYMADRVGAVLGTGVPCRDVRAVARSGPILLVPNPTDVAKRPGPTP